MGRGACSSTTDGLTRGAWTAFEDQILTDYIKIHGEGRWSRVSKETGLKRHGKSCRLRWLNYLRPEIKRGNISLEEEDLIIRLHRLLGNRWSLIAGRLPGRTDNEIKNYWNSTLKKKVKPEKSAKELKSKKKPMEEEEHVKSSIKVAVLEPSICEEGLVKNIPSESEYSGDGLLPISTCGNDNSWDFITDLYVDQVSLSETIHSDYSKLCEFNNNIMIVEECKNGCKNDPLSSSSEQPLFFEEMLKYWAGDENFH